MAAITLRRGTWGTKTLALYGLDGSDLEVRYQHRSPQRMAITGADVAELPQQPTGRHHSADARPSPLQGLCATAAPDHEPALASGGTDPGGGRYPAPAGTGERFRRSDYGLPHLNPTQQKVLQEGTRVGPVAILGREQGSAGQGGAHRPWLMAPASEGGHRVAPTQEEWQLACWLKQDSTWIGCRWSDRQRHRPLHIAHWRCRSLRRPTIHRDRRGMAPEHGQDLPAQASHAAAAGDP